MKVLFFSSIAEITGLNEQDLPVLTSVGELKRWLETTYPSVRNIRYAVAVNRKIAGENERLDENAEIAILPPFSGG